MVYYRFEKIQNNKIKPTKKRHWGTNKKAGNEIMTGQISTILNHTTLNSPVMIATVPNSIPSNILRPKNT